MPAHFIYNPAGMKTYIFGADLKEPSRGNNNYRIQEMERVIVVLGLFVFECV